MARQGNRSGIGARWVARLAAWACLLALSVHQLAPPALAELAAPPSAGGGVFVCHAGAPAHNPAPAQSGDDFGCCGHCPLCQLLHAPAFVPPARTDFGLAAPRPVALPRPPIPAGRPPARIAASLTPLHPRAPPVAV